MKNIVIYTRHKLSLWDKLFKKFKSSCFNIDWKIYKEARNDVQRLIKYKKKKYCEENLAENIAKPKKVWQALKSLGLPNKKTSQSNIYLEPVRRRYGFEGYKSIVGYVSYTGKIDIYSCV